MNRENGSFVFTNQYATVFGGKEGPKYAQFENICARAFNIVRKNADLFINLFCMMVSTGIPELRSIEDIKYFGDHVFLEMTDEKAAQLLKREIELSRTSVRTLGNGLSHHAQKILSRK